MAMCAPTPDWHGIRRAERIWSTNKVRELMDDYMAIRAVAIDTFGSGGEDVLCDVIQLDEALKGVPPLLRAAAVLHMHCFTAEEMEHVLASGRPAMALVFEAAQTVRDLERDRADH